MNNCQLCGRPGTVRTFAEVLTQHIRGMREQRAQALGDVVQICLCEDCIHRAIADQAAQKRSLRLILPHAGLLIVGAALCALPALLGKAQTLFGAALMGVALLGGAQSWRQAGQRRTQASRALVGEGREAFVEALARRWLPERSGENALRYIYLYPGIEHTRPAQLGLRYELLPRIALQLSDRLTGKEAMPAPKELGGGEADASEEMGRA